MALPLLTALAFCLVISTGGSQGFTVEPAQSDLNVHIGEDAEFTVRASSAISSVNWTFKSKAIVTWIGTTPLILAEYRPRVNLNTTSGSLVLRSVSESDNGDYTVTVTEVGGVVASATITLQAFELHRQSYPEPVHVFPIIIVIMIAVIIASLLYPCLTSALCAWFIAKKICRANPAPRTNTDTDRNVGRDNTLAANAGDGSRDYENISGIEQGRRSNAPVGDPTYMGLKLEDRSVYSELQR